MDEFPPAIAAGACARAGKCSWNAPRYLFIGHNSLSRRRKHHIAFLLAAVNPTHMPWQQRLPA
jgi:hypothetical protein